MVDYAISAVGRASGDDRLVDSSPSNEVRRFEELGTHADSPWDKIDDSRNQIRIIQEASSSDGQLKTAMPPWDDISSRVVNGLDNAKRDWDRSERSILSFFYDKSDKMDLTSEEGLNAMRSGFLKMLKLQHRMANNLNIVTLFTSIGTTFKNSISTLFRQQG